MSTKSEIINLLKSGLTKTKVYDTLVEPSADSQLPLISVQVVDVNYSLEGRTTYRTSEKISVAVTVQSVDNYITLLDEIVTYCIATVITNPIFISKFESMPNFGIKYFNSSGDNTTTNYSIADITFSFEYSTSFEPLVEANFDKVHINLDMISPSDINLFTSNPLDYLNKPDGRIDATLEKIYS